MKCCQMADADIPAKLIRDHVSGHTKLLKPQVTTICQSCLCEIMLDSQWSIGFKNRIAWLNEFFYNNDITDPAIEQILTAGFSALADMCPVCNGMNGDGAEWIKVLCESKNWEGFLNLKSNRGRFPHIERAHKKVTDLVAPQSEYADKDFYGWLYCPKCTQKLELSEVDQFSRQDIISYQGLWLTKAGRDYFEKRKQFHP